LDIDSEIDSETELLVEIEEDKDDKDEEDDTEV
jgi:hypothetical protein